MTHTSTCMHAHKLTLKEVQVTQSKHKNYGRNSVFEDHNFQEKQMMYMLEIV